MNQTIHRVYKIRNKETGLFSKGGSSGYNIWSKEGKSWSNIGHLKNHLNLFVGYSGKKSSDYPYDNSEIVEVEVNYAMCFTTDVNEMIQVIIDKKDQEKKYWEEKNSKWREEQELKQLKELQSKYTL